MGKRRKTDLRTAVVGYGPSYNMGDHHLKEMMRVGFRPVAMCDRDPKRVAAAEEAYPEIEGTTDLTAMLRRSDLDMVAVLVPHNAHFKVARACLEAGKHVLLEKPLCLTVKEADTMIALAKRKKRMLTAYHNRRFDGSFKVIRQLVRDGRLGRVFQIETAITGYSEPDPAIWRNHVKSSGGTLYDWGAHLVDQMLLLMEGRPIRSVIAHSHDGVFPACSNKDHMELVIRFDDGATARLTVSTLVRIAPPRWRILGEEGTLEEDEPGASLKAVTPVHGTVSTLSVRYPEDEWGGLYDNLADHLMRGKPLGILPESARRVIAVLEAATRSDRRGGAAVKVAHERPAGAK